MLFTNRTAAVVFARFMETIRPGSVYAVTPVADGFIVKRRVQVTGFEVDASTAKFENKNTGMVVIGGVAIA